MSVLRQRMQEDMAVRGLATGTQTVYLRAVKGLSTYTNKPLDRLSGREIQQYLLHLHDKRGLTWTTCNGVVHGLRFFYRVTLGRSQVDIAIPRAKEPSKLPIILSRQDI